MMPRSNKQSVSGAKGEATKATTNSKAKDGKMKYKKAPGAPKRFKSGFMFFSEHHHKVIRREGDGGSSITLKIRAADAAKMVSLAWKELSPDDRSKWLEMARLDRERFEREKAAYKGPWKIPVMEDPNCPKKPMSAYLAFGNERRKSISEANPSMSNAQISSLLSKLWKECPAHVKQAYRDREAQERESFKRYRTEWARQNDQTLLAQASAAAVAAIAQNQNQNQNNSNESSSITSPDWEPSCEEDDAGRSSPASSSRHSVSDRVVVVGYNGNSNSNSNSNMGDLQRHNQQQQQQQQPNSLGGLHYSSGSEPTNTSHAQSAASAADVPMDIKVQHYPSHYQNRNANNNAAAAAAAAAGNIQQRQQPNYPPPQQQQQQQQPSEWQMLPPLQLPSQYNLVDNAAATQSSLQQQSHHHIGQQQQHQQRYQQQPETTTTRHDDQWFSQMFPSYESPFMMDGSQSTSYHRHHRHQQRHQQQQQQQQQQHNQQYDPRRSGIASAPPSPHSGSSGMRFNRYGAPISSSSNNNVRGNPMVLPFADGAPAIATASAPASAGQTTMTATTTGAATIMNDHRRYSFPVLQSHPQLVVHQPQQQQQQQQQHNDYSIEELLQNEELFNEDFAPDEVMPLMHGDGNGNDNDDDQNSMPSPFSL